jgi:vancomycin aglycone glucosyltransferase
MFGDQPFWASRVRAVGVGVSILPTELSVERLAAALHEVAQPRITERAEALAPQMAADGASVAAQLLSELTA